jgi:hypothetical protein
MPPFRLPVEAKVTLILISNYLFHHAHLPRPDVKQAGHDWSLSHRRLMGSAQCR